MGKRESSSHGKRQNDTRQRNCRFGRSPFDNHYYNGVKQEAPMDTETNG